TVGEGAVAVAVVSGALLFVGEHLVGLPDLLELLLGAVIVRIFIRMILHREAAVGLLDLAPRGLAGHLQGFVIAALFHGITKRWRARTTRRRSPRGEGVP